MRRAGEGDSAAIEAFLARHPDSSMFLRSNLAAFGTGGTGHRNATVFHLSEEAGAIAGVFGRTAAGFLVCQAPGLGQDAFAAYARALDGQNIAAITGPPDQVARLTAALALRDDTFVCNRDEPLYRLDLAALAPVSEEIRAPEAGDVAMLSEWFLHYVIDSGLAAGTESDGKAARDRAAAAVGSDRIRLLIENGRPVAMSGINAAAGGMIQLGGVFAPRDRRNRGLARRAVAAQLTEARAAGTKTAVLFAASAAACRAYEAVGFRRVGAYRLALLALPVTVGGAAWA